MAAHKILLDRKVIHTQLTLNMLDCKRYDIISWWAGTGDTAMRLLKATKGSRIIVGGNATDYSKAISVAHAVAPAGGRVAFLEGCHIKLYIFYGSLPPSPRVILGSMNLGAGLPYEIAVELTGIPARECVMHFNNLWAEATPVKGDVLKRAVVSLSTTHFEQTGH